MNLKVIERDEKGDEDVKVLLLKVKRQFPKEIHICISCSTAVCINKKKQLDF